jgi:glutaminyl-tRNA synthetase
MSEPVTTAPKDFIHEIVDEHNRTGRFGGRVHTRFPPEPSGYLHIAHAKVMSIDFGLARDYGGKCNLRFDDTNPVREEAEFVDGIMETIRWLGWDWEDRLFFASDYFQQLYEWAQLSIRKGKAYVCDLSPDEVREYRGDLTTPGKNSPWRDRSVEENLDLFGRMKKGEFPDGSRTLRAKIDMAHPNFNMRDPVMYRILHAEHHRTGTEWCIYPMYDWAHGQSDSIEGVTHSLCDVGYEDHRPLYEWFCHELGIYCPQQIEFGRFSVTYTVLGKRILKRFVNEGLVSGWDDPRMPTIVGLRRRGYTPEAINDLCTRTGVSKTNTVIEIQLLEHCIREDLNKRAPRAMAVLDPLRVVIENWPTGQDGSPHVEWVDAVNNPEDESMGTRKIPFSGELYVERDDYREDPPKGWFRLGPDREVRLKHGYYIKCREAIKDDAGTVVELRCTYDPESGGGTTPDGRAVKGTLHWVSAAHAVDAEVRLYDYLFTKPDPHDVPDDAPEGADFMANFNHDSLKVLTGCKVELMLRESEPGDRFQFLRQGYFCTDPDSTPELVVFNRTVGLKDSWSKLEKKK